MLRRILFAASGIVLYAASAFALSDVRGSRDHALFPRPAGYRIVSYSSEERSVELPVQGEVLLFSGRSIDILYKTEDRPLSRAALGERFLSFLKKAGGEVVFQENPALGGRVIVGRLRRPGRDVQVMQDVVSLRAFRLLIAESPQDRVFPSPLSAVPDPAWETEAGVLDLLHLVDRTGRLDFSVKFARGSSVPLKGYETDFKKCVLLMEKDPSLKFRLSTWTDAGMKPAEQRIQFGARTAALVDTLTRMGADAERLAADPSQNAGVPQGVVRLTVVDSTDDAPGPDRRRYER
jgi:hypothetical protein